MLDGVGQSVDTENNDETTAGKLSELKVILDIERKRKSGNKKERCIDEVINDLDE